jgi:hypothetical protein
MGVVRGELTTQTTRKILSHAGDTK